MGFTAGFVGGVALTSSVLYLTVAIHRQNRLQQAGLLSQQKFFLQNIVDPQPPPPPPTAREARAGIVELAKDRWNGQLEDLVRKVHSIDWDEVRTKWEGKTTGLVEKIKETGGGGVATTVSRREG